MSLLTFDCRTAESVELDFEQAMIDVSTGLPQPDPAWRYTDAHGHVHVWDMDKRAYLTLTEVIDQEGYDGGGDDDVYWPTISHWECRRCGEHITPGTIIILDRQYQPGLRSWSVRAVLSAATPQDIQIALMQAVDLGQPCMFQFSLFSGEGVISELLSSSDGPFVLAIQGRGPITRTDPAPTTP